MSKKLVELWSKSVLDNTNTPMNWQDAANSFAIKIICEITDIIWEHPSIYKSTKFDLDDKILRRFYNE